MGLRQNISASVFSAVVIKYSNKRSFRGKGLISAHSSRSLSSPWGKSQRQELGAAGHSAAALKKQRDECTHVHSSLSPFILSRTWAGNGSAHSGKSLLISTKIIPHSYAQRPISRVRADVCQVEINVYINSVCSRSGAHVLQHQMRRT